MKVRLHRDGLHRYVTDDGYVVRGMYGWSKAQNPKPVRWSITGPDGRTWECPSLPRVRECIEARRARSAQVPAVKSPTEG